MISSLLQQIKKRRLALALKQNDMMMRVGISRQQYQRLESKGNPRLDTLELVAKGLNSELLLIPNEKLHTVRAVLESEQFTGSSEHGSSTQTKDQQKKSLSDDPWQDLLGNDS
ncbi:MAG: helix-turn-helix transcriptional regulator [Oleiphilus sp.]